eukprot:3292725-Alexandrium_andersonii.AAC.1
MRQRAGLQGRRAPPARSAARQGGLRSQPDGRGRGVPLCPLRSDPPRNCGPTCERRQGCADP